MRNILRSCHSIVSPAWLACCACLAGITIASVGAFANDSKSRVPVDRDTHDSHDDLGSGDLDLPGSDLAKVPGMRVKDTLGQPEWCQTDIKWKLKAGQQDGVAGGCPTQGSCDVPSVRDSWIPSGSTPITTLCIKFNVFANDDGSSSASTQAGVDAQVAQLNADYLPSRIQFEASTEFINDTTFRQFADSEESAMKSAWADSPSTQLNVYVVNIQAGYLGVGTFPWDADATGTLGGIIIDDNFFGAGQRTLTHEVGHCLGLWHTHHGVSEVSTCSACWERADGLNGDTTGDFAADTAPTPTNFNCSPPGGTDSCSGTPWGATDTQNYMGYAPDSCYTEFSVQQDGRQHCWIDAELQGWFCEARGACCHDGGCDVITADACTALGGTYLGDGTDCDSSAGNPLSYGSTVNGAIPDAGGPGNAISDTIMVSDSFIIGDVNVGFDIAHTWVGDVTVEVSHQGTTVTIMDRPGFSGTGFGCSADNMNVVLDDEGVGGSIEAQCANDLSSPPNYTPNNPLSAFDGLDASGDWTITVYDSATGDPGSFGSWSLEIDGQGTGPCDSGCTTNGDCDDGLFCNGTETCDAGTCQAGTPVNCDDSISCTLDSCNESTDSCDNTADDSLCDNGDFCDGAETCNAATGCEAGTAIDCDDGVACTNDSCNESTDSCDNTPDDSACDNGDFCDGAETCDASLDCQSGTAVDCDDSNPCTVDSCNESTDSCDNTADDSLCDDGLFCNGAETCGAAGCEAGSDPCPGQVCDESTDSCVSCIVDADCDDGLFCNGSESCNAGVCDPGTPPVCDDGIFCTADSCNESTDSCDNTPDDSACDNGDFCDGAETCDASLDCQSGTAVDCDDSNPCTVDSCNESTDSCDNTADDSLCDDGLFCNGAETCGAAGCEAGSDPCPGQICDESTDSCVSCIVDADCDDGLFCNGSESCNAGDCDPGTPPVCDDGIFCTADSCNESTDSCDNIADDSACDNGMFCDGAETCNAATGCESGTAVDCDDGVSCTNDSCNETSDACDNVVDDSLCDDGLFCNGAETCDASADCLPGSDPCGGGACDEVTDTCPTPDTGACCPGDGTCSETTATDCAAISGSYEGDGTVCSPNPCPALPGPDCSAIRRIRGRCNEDGSIDILVILFNDNHDGETVVVALNGDPIALTIAGRFASSNECCYTGAVTLTLETPGDCVDPVVMACSGDPVGACCDGAGGCTQTTQADCSGTYLGDETSCAGDPCQGPTGACCFADGSCTETEGADCTGTYQGDGTTCSPNTCPQPMGACCAGDGTCSISTAADCAGTYQGDGTDCASSPCPLPDGACCFGTTGSIETAADCSTGGGSYLGDGSSCSPDPCAPPPTGACCNDQACSIDTQANCSGAGGVYQGDGSSCTPGLCDATSNIDCSEIRRLRVRCNGDQTVDLLVILTNDSHDGEFVTVSLDGVPIDLQINGRFASGSSCCHSGTVTAELIDPPNCIAPETSICP